MSELSQSVKIILQIRDWRLRNVKPNSSLPKQQVFKGGFQCYTFNLISYFRGCTNILTTLWSIFWLYIGVVGPVYICMCICVNHCLEYFIYYSIAESEKYLNKLYNSIYPSLLTIIFQKWNLKVFFKGDNGFYTNLRP